MLRNLKIRKYALIDTLDIDFHRGFSVITGETGAGKSIMLGAINLILGGRADAKFIKDGAEKCFVEAVFEENNEDIATFFSENDFDYDGKECVVRREISKSGKSRAFINDTPATVSQLKELGQKLVDIHSQHKNLLISGTDFQIGVIDSVARNFQERNDYFAKYSEFKKFKANLKNFAKISQKNRKTKIICATLCNNSRLQI